MKQLTAFLLCLALALLPCAADTVIVVGQKPYIAAGGPDVYYYSATDGSEDANLVGNTNQIYRAAVTVAAGGTATTVGIKIRTHYGGSETIKMALADGDTVLSSGTVLANGSGWFEVTLAAPQAVTAKAYNVMFAFAGSSTEPGTDAAGVNGTNVSTSGTYAGFPPVSWPGTTSSVAVTLVRIYVD